MLPAELKKLEVELLLVLAYEESQVLSLVANTELPTVTVPITTKGLSRVVRVKQ